MTFFLKYLEEPVTLAAGDMTHWFIDAREVYRDEHMRESVLDCWERALALYTPKKPWHFVSVPTGGDDWAHAIATRLGVKWGRPDHDTVERKEGMPVIVEDVITTGGSVNHVKEAYEDLYTTSMLLVVARRHAHPVTASWIDFFNLD